MLDPRASFRVSFLSFSASSPLKSLRFTEPTGSFKYYKSTHHVKMMFCKPLEFEQAPGVGNGWGGLVCCSPWGCKESDTTGQLNRTES